MYLQTDLELTALECVRENLAMGMEDIFFYPGCFPGGRITGPKPRDLRLGQSLHGRITGPRPRD